MSRRHRRRHRRGSSQGVQLNLAAMLDMAFQLLAFFILTFRPAPVEGQLAVNMPPPVAQTNIGKSKPSEAITVTGFEMLQLFVLSNESGQINEIRLEGNVIARGRPDAAAYAQVSRQLASAIDLGAGTEGI